MNLSDFDYNLPKGSIAQHPLKERDTSKLLVLNRDKLSIAHKNFFGILGFLKSGDLLVMNNTKVLSARLIGRKVTGGKVDVLLLGQKSRFEFDCLVKPRLKVNQEVLFNGTGLIGKFLGDNRIVFNLDASDVYAAGVMPLPPYIKRTPENEDFSCYQTIFAENPGAIAAPTAGLHFTQGLLERIKEKGVNLAYITLHVGQGTFKPIKEEDITKHKMHKESFEISKEAYIAIKDALTNKKRIIAVGTTSCRVLETLAGSINEVKDFPIRGETDLYIYPGYKFKAVGALITNFHLPKTTLFLLVSAFAGLELIKKSYQEAIAKEYRFYSYGDAMMIV